MLKLFRRIWVACLTIFLFLSSNQLVGETIDEFFSGRPDIRENIEKWSGNSDKIWILKEWVKITTERNNDYHKAKKILEELESDSKIKPSGEPAIKQEPSKPKSAPFPGNAEPARFWDTRLDARGVKIIPAKAEPGRPYWRVTEGKWENEAEARGRVNIYVELVDENGVRTLGTPVIFFWPSGEASSIGENKPPPEYGWQMGMNQPGNCYGIRVEGGLPSDRVEGMGLGSIEEPWRKTHVCYWIKFQKTISPPLIEEPETLPQDGFTTPTQPLF